MKAKDSEAQARELIKTVESTFMPFVNDLEEALNGHACLEDPAKMDVLTHRIVNSCYRLYIAMLQEKGLLNVTKAYAESIRTLVDTELKTSG